MKSSKAQHVSFNSEDPIILVGDEKGGVNSYKLSESLFQGPRQPNEDEIGKITVQELEIQKLNDFLNAQDKEVYWENKVLVTPYIYIMLLHALIHL